MSSEERLTRFEVRYIDLQTDNRDKIEEGSRDTCACRVIEPGVGCPQKALVFVVALPVVINNTATEHICNQNFPGGIEKYCMDEHYEKMDSKEVIQIQGMVYEW